MKSEGSQPIYCQFKNPIKTEFGNRIMVEVGTIRGLEIDDTKNYIIVPFRVENKDGKERTTSWAIHEIHKDCNVNFKLHIDNDKWFIE